VKRLFCYDKFGDFWFSYTQYAFPMLNSCFIYIVIHYKLNANNFTCFIPANSVDVWFLPVSVWYVMHGNGDTLRCWMTSQRPSKSSCLVRAQHAASLRSFSDQRRVSMFHSAFWLSALIIPYQIKRRQTLTGRSVGRLLWCHKRRMWLNGSSHATLK